ncbi:hypothetical protein PF008_g148 [Phytophthora fragariae]|uniref:Uncharacterized protein n=1 Tax=Phytophthora fragariae TaxID=53985 RepID=A0A6G0SQ00_9STRA|nr:hypothetical protein PF008_g148 [Phytophthora fragariae]
MTVAAHKDSSPQPQRSLESLIDTSTSTTPMLVAQNVEAAEGDSALNSDYEEFGRVMTRVLTQPPSLLVSLLHLVLCHPLTGVQCLYPKNVPNKRLQLRSVQQRKKLERERWKYVIDNWRSIEGQHLTKLANGSVALKRMRKEG